METDFWTIVLDPVFLVTVGLIGVPFAALAYSVWVTWQNNTGEPEDE